MHAHAVRFMHYGVTFTQVCMLRGLCTTVWHPHVCTRCEVYSVLCDIHTRAHAVRFMHYTGVHAVTFMQFRWLPSNTFFCFAEKALQPLLTVLELAWPHGCLFVNNVQQHTWAFPSCSVLTVQQSLSSAFPECSAIFLSEVVGVSLADFVIM